jgi:hypothetical protein
LFPLRTSLFGEEISPGEDAAELFKKNIRTARKLKKVSGSTARTLTTTAFLNIVKAHRHSNNDMWHFAVTAAARNRQLALLLLRKRLFVLKQKADKGREAWAMRRLEAAREQHAAVVVMSSVDETSLASPEFEFKPSVE